MVKAGAQFLSLEPRYYLLSLKLPSGLQIQIIILKFITETFESEFCLLPGF